MNEPAATFFGPILFPEANGFQKANNQWDIAEFENSIGADPDNHTIWDCNEVPAPPNDGSNLTYYCNSQVDQWEQQQLQSADQATRMQLFHNIHVQILKDIPTFYLYAPEDSSEYKLTVHNYMPDSEGPAETWNVADWWCTGGSC